MNSSERIPYMNGGFIPESEAKVHFRDRSFKYGDGVFDMTRTFGHKIFKIERKDLSVYPAESSCVCRPSIRLTLERGRGSRDDAVTKTRNPACPLAS